jgi:hypothetical protein
MSDARDSGLGGNPRGEGLDVRRGVDTGETSGRATAGPTSGVDAGDVRLESGSAKGAAGGAVGGMLAGAAAGTITLGPIGTIIGALAGAVGGGWVGMAAGGTERHYADTHDAAYRTHYERSPDRLADRSYEHARPAFQLGHLAAHVPEYRGRDFDAVEPHLRSAWTDDVQAKHGEWDHARRWARTAYEYARGGAPASELATDASAVVPVEVIRPGEGATTTSSRDGVRDEMHLMQTIDGGPDQGRIAADPTLGGTESHQRPSFADPIPPGDPEHLSGDQRRVSGRDDVSE